MTNLLHARRAFVALSRVMAPGLRHGVIHSTRVGGSLCVLRTRGRVTGRPREAALDYASAPDGGIWLAAGWGTETRWYRNLVADARVEVTIDRRTRRGTAMTVADPDERLRAIRAILVASGFVARLCGYDPAAVSDERLDRAFAATPIVHVAFD